MKRMLFGLGCALFISNAASAVPMLQLDIAGGSYDDVDQTIVTTADTFTVYAYATPSGNVSGAAILGGTYYLSIALTPETSDAATLGSFTVNGTTYLATSDMTYGVPPIEANGTAVPDGGDLGGHDVYGTYFIEIPFTFSAANVSGEYNTEDDAGQGPIAGDDMFYSSFSIDKSLLSDAHQLHFDLYSKQNGRTTGDLDIGSFAPFSHDAGTVPPIPEPTAALIFGGALLLTKVSTRRRS